MDRYRFAALAACCLILSACGAARPEPSAGEKAYQQKLNDAQELIEPSISALRRAQDLSASDEHRAAARAQLDLDGHGCLAFRQTLAELRAAHERVYNQLERPFTHPAGWDELAEWCSEGA